MILTRNIYVSDVLRLVKKMKIFFDDKNSEMSHVTNNQGQILNKHCSFSLSANSNFVLSSVTHNIVKRIKSIKVTPIKYDEHALDAKVSSSKTALTTSTHKFNFLLK